MLRAVSVPSRGQNARLPLSAAAGRRSAAVAATAAAQIGCCHCGTRSRCGSCNRAIRGFGRRTHYTPSCRRRIVFFGDCIPNASGVQVAVSYKYWVDGSTNPEGDPCLGECGNNEFCESSGDVSSCVCKPDCGGCGSGLKCQPTTCSCVPDIG